MNSRILHIITLDKFIPPFIDFVGANFDISKHHFLIIGKKKYEYGLAQDHPVTWIDKISKIFTLLIAMYKAEKIILHGLWNKQIIQLLFLQPWLLKKCYWCIWGGDLYYYQNRPKKFLADQFEKIRTSVIGKIGHFVTYIEGDYELAKKWYGAKGRYHECFGYISNLYKDYDITSKAHEIINIQVGNSADPTNNHFEVLDSLIRYKGENIKIFLPLSYGNQSYAQKVIEYGKNKFGEKLVPMTNFMPFEEYLAFLSTVDIAIFNHNRQQALGNTITLLGLGKKVFVRSSNTTWSLFEKENIKIFDINDLELSVLDEETKSINTAAVKKYFSYGNLVRQWREIFEQ